MSTSPTAALRHIAAAEDDACIRHDRDLKRLRENWGSRPESEAKIVARRDQVLAQLADERAEWQAILTAGR